MSTSSKRILAGAVALALCLSPAALAAKTEEPPLVAAVAGLSPCTTSLTPPRAIAPPCRP